jgi:hypothetical protein
MTVRLLVSVEVVSTELAKLPKDAELQAAGCQTLAAACAAGGAPGQEAVREAGGVAAAVAALSTLADEPAVRHGALFLLANLASASDECKEALGAAGAPTALAKLVATYRGRADVLRLVIGALAQLGQRESGRKHVIASPAPSAVVLGIRAHASDAVVCDEACYFLASLVYGGREGRQAALDAGADESLRMIARRFGGKATHEKTVSMAKTILARLEQGVAEEGLTAPSFPFLVRRSWSQRPRYELRGGEPWGSGPGPSCTEWV